MVKHNPILLILKKSSVVVGLENLLSNQKSKIFQYPCIQDKIAITSFHAYNISCSKVKFQIVLFSLKLYVDYDNLKKI